MVDDFYVIKVMTPGNVRQIHIPTTICHIPINCLSGMYENVFIDFISLSLGKVLLSNKSPVKNIKSGFCLFITPLLIQFVDIIIVEFLICILATFL